MNDSTKQQYDPTTRNRFTEAERARYQQAIDSTAGVYMTYNQRVFDAQYRSTSERWTLDYGGLPNKRIYDLAGFYHDDVGNGAGLAQKNANHYALGRNDIGLLPPYDAQRLLAHYLTGIGFVGYTPNPPNDYRFNVSYFEGYDDRRDNPLVLYTGDMVDFSYIVQNTGVNTWTLSCPNAYPWHDTALSFHWYGYPDNHFQGQNPYFEGFRNRLCGANLAPGDSYPAQAETGEPQYATAQLNVNVPPGEYWLRLDMEFRSASIWGSRLNPAPSSDPNSNRENALWPTQDIRVRVIARPTDVPRPVPVDDNSSSHISGEWSSNNTVALAWKPVQYLSELMVYQICWDKHDDGLGQSCKQTTNPYFSVSIPEGIYDFEVIAQADDKTSEAWEINDIRIDTTPPTVTLNALPAEVHEAVNVAWSSSDNNGSGIAQTRLQYRRNGEENWHELLSSTGDLNQTLFSFPGGEQNDRFEFQLQVCDNVDNCTEWETVSTIYKPNPQLQLNQPAMVWLTTLAEYPTSITRSIHLQNSGGGTLTWIAQKISGDYVNLSNITSGQIKGCQTDLPLELTHPGALGTYRGEIKVNDTLIPVTIKVIDSLYLTYLPIIMGGQPSLQPCFTGTDNQSPQTRLVISSQPSSQDWYNTPLQ